MNIRGVIAVLLLIGSADMAYSVAVDSGMTMGGRRVNDFPVFTSEAEFLSSVDEYRKIFYQKGWISFTERPGWKMIIMGGHKFWQNSAAVWKAGYR